MAEGGRWARWWEGTVPPGVSVNYNFIIDRGGGVYAIIVHALIRERFLSDEYEVKFRCDGNWCNYKRQCVFNDLSCNLII